MQEKMIGCLSFFPNGSVIDRRQHPNPAGYIMIEGGF